MYPLVQSPPWRKKVQEWRLDTSGGGQGRAIQSVFEQADLLVYCSFLGRDALAPLNRPQRVYRAHSYLKRGWGRIYSWVGNIQVQQVSWGIGGLHCNIPPPFIFSPASSWGASVKGVGLIPKKVCTQRRTLTPQNQYQYHFLCLWCYIIYFD